LNDPRSAFIASTRARARARAGISFVVFDRRSREDGVPTKTIFVGVADRGCIICSAASTRAQLAADCQ
jgi:hypothetical protein